MSVVNKIDIVRKMQIKLSSYYQRFKNMYDRNKNLQKHITASCINNMVHFVFIIPIIIIKVIRYLFI